MRRRTFPLVAAVEALTEEGYGVLTADESAAVAQAALKLERIQEQVDLYEMSRNDDTAGLDPESTIVCIANILEGEAVA